MKTSITSVVMWLLASVTASAVEFTVTANPLWTDTGIHLSTLDSITIYDANGSWSWGYQQSSSFGPDGDYEIGPAFSGLEDWIKNDLYGQLIGYVGSAGDLNSYNSSASPPRVIDQNDPGLFEIGTKSVQKTGLEGELWLGFNDDYSGNAIWDNSGRVNVQVDVVPEPSTTISFAVVAAIGLMAYAWQRRKTTL